MFKLRHFLIIIICLSVCLPACLSACLSVSLDDVIIGAPLYMDRVKEQLQERGQVVVYLQRRHAPFLSRPDQSLTGFSLYGRFGSAVVALGDMDMDGYQDVAVGAPWSGDGGRGQVFVYLGNSNGLSAMPSQVIDSPLPSNRAAFGFTLRGGADIDGNGYPELWAELQLDKMKQPMARRTLLLSSNQPQETFKLSIRKEVGVACVNKTAYLRSEAEVRDKLSPIFITANISLLNTTQHAVLHGHTYAVAQTRIILDCGDDNLCVPDLRLSAEAASHSVFVGEDQSVLLWVSAENRGEGAYEAELFIHVPPHTHYQSTQGQRLVCVQRKENHTVVVTCDLGNPMRQGDKLKTGLLFSVGRLEEVESHICFKLRVRRYVIPTCLLLSTCLPLSPCL
uniref:Uncharacterized protein n=1 Tax=Myripristis murdjan TaxID=586833 RepID=A0A667WUF2_9TELE